MVLLLDDPRIRAIDVHECGEPLLPLPERLSAPDRPRIFVRESVLRRLEQAAGLLPPRVRLQVVEGHRTIEDQLAILERYGRVVREESPHLTEAEHRRLVSRFVAPIEVAPHVAGAAIDVTLADRRGSELWMGTRIDATPEESDGACFFAAPGIGRRARRNRQLLALVLGGVGFVNYPTEWWHWSFGDRYWANANGLAHAVYGPVEVAETVGAR